MSTEIDWSGEAFFDIPEPSSLDGGTTSTGTLWHGVSPRWGHSMHTMCSYQGMFPAKVAHYFVQRYSRPGGTVLDPFSGRGTTALQAKVTNRRTVSNDLSPLAYALTRAKAVPPSWEEVNDLVDTLERGYKRSKRGDADVSDDIRMLYHENTLKQLCYVRSRLLSTPISTWSRCEMMLAGALSGIMHGGWRRDDSSQYLSISMPNTFSMPPAYVRKFIEENQLEKLDQDVFSCVRDKLARLYIDAIPGPDGVVHHADASSLLNKHLKPSSVDLIVTSPPYLRVVNYGTSNWIRLWLLGIDEVGREQGVGRKKLDADLDHRHTYTSYRDFMLRIFTGTQRVLKRDGVAVFVIGDVADPGKTPVPLAARIWSDVAEQTNLELLELIEDDLPVQKKVSRIWGETKGNATNRDCVLVLTRRGGTPSICEAEVNWDEPYKEAGPDAAYERVRRGRLAS